MAFLQEDVNSAEARLEVCSIGDAAAAAAAAAVAEFFASSRFEATGKKTNDCLRHS